eukprot:6172666-Pleurochrysis_carterae.AAC.1
MLERRILASMTKPAWARRQAFEHACKRAHDSIFACKRSMRPAFCISEDAFASMHECEERESLHEASQNNTPAP